MMNARMAVDARGSVQRGDAVATDDTLTDGDKVLITGGEFAGASGTIVRVLASGNAEVRIVIFGRDAGTFAIELSHLTRSSSD